MSNKELASPNDEDFNAEDREFRGTEEKVISHSKELLKIGTESCPSSLLLQKKSSPKGSLETFRPQPSAVLSSVKSFLPQLSAANEQLTRQLQTAPPGQLDIQNLEDCDGPIIEMNLALFPTGQSSSSESSSSEDEEDEKEEEDLGDNQSKTGLAGEVTEHNLRLTKDTKARKRPKIEELGNNDKPKR